MGGRYLIEASPGTATSQIGRNMLLYSSADIPICVDPTIVTVKPGYIYWNITIQIIGPELSHEAAFV